MIKNTLRLVSTVLSAWIVLSMMSFACRQDAGGEASPELKAEIETIEAEVADIEQTEQEIQDATAKVDSLLNELN